MVLRLHLRRAFRPRAPNLFVFGIRFGSDRWGPRDIATRHVVDRSHQIGWEPIAHLLRRIGAFAQDGRKLLGDLGLGRLLVMDGLVDLDGHLGRSEPSRFPACVGLAGLRHDLRKPLGLATAGLSELDRVMNVSLPARAGGQNRTQVSNYRR